MTRTLQDTANTARLRDLAHEVDALLRSGNWNHAAYKRLLDEAEKACAGDGDRLEFLYLHAHPAWLEDDLQLQ